MRGSDDRPATALPRRALLITGLAGGAAALGGCQWPGQHREQAGTQGPAHPLTTQLAAALALVSTYDRTIARQSGLATRLAPLRAEHWTHVTAISSAMGEPAPSAAPSPDPNAAEVPADADAALAGLRDAEKSAQSDAAAACIAAPATYTELLGSIAACRATHIEVLS